MAPRCAPPVVGPEWVDPVGHGPEALSLGGVADRVRGHHRAAAVRCDLRAGVCAEVVVPGGVFVSAVVGGDHDYVWPVVKVKDRVRAWPTGFGPGGGEQR